MHSSIDVANKLLELAKNKGRKFTQFELIKLVYLCHCEMLIAHKKPLIDDVIYAWKHGPVIKTLRDVIKDYKKDPIIYPIRPYQEHKNFNSEEENIISKTFKKYEKYSASDFYNLTHAPNTPWDIVYNQYEKSTTDIENIISNSAILISALYFNQNYYEDFFNFTPVGKEEW